VLSEYYRMRNLEATLRALNEQTVPRSMYKIVIVEQDKMPYLKKDVAHLCDKYIADEYDLPFNRSRAVNRGVAEAKPKASDLVCVLDADLFVDPGWIERCVLTMNDDEVKPMQALLPFSSVLYLASGVSDDIVDAEIYPFGAEDLPTIRVGKSSVGGCMWVRSAVYSLIGGHDERFIGWGCEDQDFFIRISHAVSVYRLDEAMLHLYHPRFEEVSEEDQKAIDRNRRLYKRLYGEQKGIFNPFTTITHHA